MGVVKRRDVYWVSLDPTVVSEIQKIRSCLIVSPDDMHAALQSVIVAPLTSGGQQLGCRPEIKFKSKAAHIALYQLRSVDKQRLGGKMGKIDLAIWHPVLLEMFACDDEQSRVNSACRVRAETAADAPSRPIQKVRCTTLTTRLATRVDALLREAVEKRQL